MRRLSSSFFFTEALSSLSESDPQRGDKDFQACSCCAAEFPALPVTVWAQLSRHLFSLLKGEQWRQWRQARPLRPVSENRK